jgi:hypothetical protein
MTSIAEERQGLLKTSSNSLLLLNNLKRSKE